MNKDGIPLPSVLSGQIVERLVRVDKALLFLVLGALVELTDDWWLEQTGTLTADAAHDALMDMVWCFQEGCDVIPVGTVQMWLGATAPDRWLLCRGQSLLRADYADLFTIIGTTWGAADGTHFNIPDMRSRSPYGYNPPGLGLGGVAGAATATLTVSQLPAHNHAVTDPGHTHRERQFAGANSFIAGAAGGSNGTIPSGTNTTNTAALDTGSNTTGISTQNTGSGDPFNIIHPVLIVNYIVYTGV